MVQSLADLCAAGWPVVPLRPGEKIPRTQGWVTQSFTADDFSPGDNIGLKTGVESTAGVFVDVDCDTDLAVVCAARILLPTRQHGRKGRPRSHFWYLLSQGDAPGNRDAYQDIDGSVLLEQRGADHQTLIPPSVHPSGEALQWENDAPLRVTTWGDLKVLVRLAATAALLTKHYPGTGSRHECAAHLGGVLCRIGLAEVQATKLTAVVAQLAGDREVEDRVRGVADTYKAYAAGRPVTGGPKFEQTWGNGEAVLARLYSWFGYAGNDTIERMNETHFVVPGTAHMLVGTEDGTDPVEFQTFGAFRERYLNQPITITGANGRTKVLTAGQAWLESPARRTYRRVVFAPPGAKPAAPDEYNLWRGFAVSPLPDPRAAEGLTRRFQTHLREVVAGGSPDTYAWLMDFFADMVQTPGRPSGKSLALVGKSGSGKSMTLEAIGTLFGHHFLSISSREQLVGRFNGHLSGKILVFADEAMWGGDRQHAGVYKRLVTQRTLAIERKGVDIINEANCLRIAIASNEDWVVPATAGERRATVLRMDDVRGRAYFADLWTELEHPLFRSALLSVLQAWPVSETRLRDGIVTDALIDQIDMSGDPVQQWWAQCLTEGACTDSEDRPWPEWVAHAELYEKFTNDMGNRGAGYNYRGTRKAFMRRLATFLGHPYSARKLVTARLANATVTSVKMALRLIPLVEARAQFDHVVGYSHGWRDVEQDEPSPSVEEELF